jgi:hypothetical protein
MSDTDKVNSIMADTAEDESGRIKPGSGDAILDGLRRQMREAGGTPCDLINVVVAAACAEFSAMPDAVKELTQLRDAVDTWLGYARELAKPHGLN